MSRNKREGRYAGKHNGQHYRCRWGEEYTKDGLYKIPSGFSAYCLRALGYVIKYKYSRQQRKRNY